MTQHTLITIRLIAHRERNSKDSLITIVQLTKRKRAFFLAKTKDEKQSFFYSS